MDTASDYAARVEDLLVSASNNRGEQRWREAELDLREAAVLAALAQAAAVVDVAATAL